MGRQSMIDAETKAQILKEVEETGLVTAVAKKYSIDPKNIYNWMRPLKNKDKYADAKKIRELEKKLKDAELETIVLKELLKKTYPRWQSAEKL